MTPVPARVVLSVALSVACTRVADSSQPEPEREPSSVESTQAASVAVVCEHIGALASAELISTDAPPGAYAEFMQGCVVNVEAVRRSLGEAEFERQASCVLVATNVAELSSCESGPPPPTREAARFPEQALVWPLADVMEQAVYSPDPDAKELQQTKAARFDKAVGISIVAFCVDVDGSTSDIHTVQKFPGDPQIDHILRDTIARWRFRPFVVGGAAVKVCAENIFRLRFM